jgi:cellulose synthase/poly-beta-1,6-N-acetylglucosamine synthase-like glycosyltransferase
MEIAAISALVLTLIYLFLLLRLYRGWRKLIATSAKPGSGTPLSIVITFRNEAEKLPRLLSTLLPQLSHSEESEIILTDDHSTDRSVKVLKELVGNHRQIKIIQPKDVSGKKACQQQGISLAKNTWVSTLDADVAIGPEWLKSLSYYAEISNSGLIILPLIIHEEKSIFSSLQSLEFFSIVFITASSASCDRALLCNGANLAFRKSLYDQFHKTRTDEEISSGDDIFLLEYAQKNDQVSWVHDKSLLAATNPEEKFLSFLSQRVRWASKSHKVEDKFLYLTALLIFSVNLAMVAALLMLPAGSGGAVILVSALLLKTVADYVVLESVARWLCKTRLMRFFPWLVLIYPVYAILIPLIGLFWKPQWKGRRIKI